jgi:hypothetical protein
MSKPKRLLQDARPRNGASMAAEANQKGFQRGAQCCGENRQAAGAVAAFDDGNAPILFRSDLIVPLIPWRCGLVSDRSLI